MHLDHILENGGEVYTVMEGDFGISAFDNPFVEALHIIRLERGTQRRHLVDYTAQ